MSGKRQVVGCSELKEDNLFQGAVHWEVIQGNLDETEEGSTTRTNPGRWARLGTWGGRVGSDGLEKPGRLLSKRGCERKEGGQLCSCDKSRVKGSLFLFSGDVRLELFVEKENKDAIRTKGRGRVRSTSVSSVLQSRLAGACS